MKAKLIKTGESFLLKDVNNETLAITSGTMQGRMLSLKNCQAIECGYDLDELANELLYSKYPFHPPNDSGYWLDMYKEGFQKALQLMGDKKFSEEDTFRMFTYGHVLTNAVKSKVIEDKPFGEIFNDFIQSLQQTEWDVEIVEEPVDLAFYENGSRYPIDANLPDRFKYKPKLDADGCLILKRVL